MKNNQRQASTTNFHLKSDYAKSSIDESEAFGLQNMKQVPKPQSPFNPTVDGMIKVA